MSGPAPDAPDVHEKAATQGSSDPGKSLRELVSHDAGTEAGAPPAAEVAARTLSSHPVRVAAVQRLLRSNEALHAPGTARGEGQRQRLDALAGWAAQLLGVTSARIALLSDVHTRVGASGPQPEDTINGLGGPSAAAGEAVPEELAEWLCTQAAASGQPLAIPDIRTDERVSQLWPVAVGAVGSYLGVPMRDLAGNVVGAVCVLEPTVHTWGEHDAAVLTQVAVAAAAELELSALEEERVEDRALLDLSIAAAQLGTFDLDLATGHLQMNERLLQLSGLTRQTFGNTPQDVYAHIHPEDREATIAAVQQSTTSGGSYAVEYRIADPLTDPPGTIRWLAARGQTRPGPDGRPARLVGAAYDITSVRENATRTEAILDHMAVGYVLMDADWVITYLNTETERIAGSHRQELLGRTLWEAFPATVGTVFEANHRRAVAEQIEVVFDAYYPHPLNVWLEVRSVPEGDGLALYFIDITTRQRAFDARDLAARRLQGIARFTLALGQVQTITDLVRTVAEDGLPELGCNGGAVATLDPDDDQQLLSYLTASYGPHAEATYGHLPLSAALPVAHAARTGEAVLIPDEQACRVYSPHMAQVVDDTGSVAFASLPLRIGGQTLGVVTAGWDHAQSFDVEQVSLLDTFAAQVAQALQRLHARDAERSATAEQAALVAIASALSAAQSEAEVFAVVAAHGVGMLGAFGASLSLCDSDGSGVRTRASDTIAPDLQATLQHLPAQTPLPLVQVAMSGTAYFGANRAQTAAALPGSEAMYEALGLQASAAVPLRAGSRLLGSLSLGFHHPRSWSQQDRDLLGAFAALTAQALARISAHDAEIAASAEVARFSETLQRSLLTSPPEPDHLHIAVRYSPAAEQAAVGGDWYDAFITAEGTTSLVIGDVTGHDRVAAAAMGQLRNLLRGIGYAIGDPPAAILTTLDRAAHDLGVDTTATALLARLEQTPEQRRRGERLLRWSNAGHLPPLLIDPDGVVSYLQAAPDLMLGVDPDTARHDHEELLEPGTTVLLYTDGLIERRDAPLQAGMDWLAATVTGLSDLPVDALLEELLALVGDQVEDDVALLAVRAYPEDEPRPPEAGPGYDPREEPTAGGTAPA